MARVQMRAPTGEIAEVESTEVDFFRRNGAVLLGPAAQQSQSPVPPAAGPLPPLPPRSSRDVMEAVVPAPVPPAGLLGGPQASMRAATPWQRLTSGAGLLSPAASERMADMMVPPAPAATGPTMRAPTLGERLRSGVADVYAGISQQPLGRVADVAGVSDFGGQARQMRGEEPMTPVMAMMPDLPGGVGTVLERGKALYLARGGGQSPARMAQALKDAGYKFGSMRTAAEKRAANAFVDRLIGEAHTGSAMVPESPFNQTTMLGVAGPIAAQGIPNDPESQLDDYARLALNVGGATALGMAGAKALKQGAKTAFVKPPPFEFANLDTPAVQRRIESFKKGAKFSFAALPQAAKPKTIHAAITAPGATGYSVHPATGQLIKGGEPGPAMAGRYPNYGTKGNAVIPFADFKPRHVEKFILDNRQTFHTDKKAFIGGWIHPETGNVHLDISRGYLTKQGEPDVRAATKFAEAQKAPGAIRNEAGVLKERGQEAIYNPETDKFLEVGNLYEFLQSPQFRNRMTAMAKIGRESMGGDNPEWWNIVNGPMAEVYGKENVEALAGYIASTSPQNGPVANLKMATELMRRHLKDVPVRDPSWRAPATAMGKVDLETGERIMNKKGRYVSEGFAPSAGQRFPNLKTVAANAEKVQAGEPSTVTEDKVNDMFHALMGKLVGVFDRHWAKIAEVPEKGIYADKVVNRLTGSMTTGNVESYALIENAVRTAAKAAGVDVSKYSAWVWEGIRDTIRTHGKLFGQVHRASAIPETTTGFNEIFTQLVDAKAKHLGITVKELHQRLRSGDAELLAALISTPIGAAAYSRWRDSAQSSPQGGGL